VSQYQKGKTNLDFTEAGDNEWQWHQLGRMQVCTSLQADSYTSTPPLSFLQAGCPSCRPTNSVKTSPPPKSSIGFWVSDLRLMSAVDAFLCNSVSEILAGGDFYSVTDF